MVCSETVEFLDVLSEVAGYQALTGPGDRYHGVLDVHFINTLPVLAASCHSRASGNPGDEGHGDWMPAYAGMTFYWRRTCETYI